MLRSLRTLKDLIFQYWQVWVLVCLCALSTNARAFTLTPYFEVQLVPAVSTAWTTVSLDNTYADAIPVCTYVLGTFAGSAGNYTNPPAVTRIRNITASSFELRIQGWEDSAASTSDVHCLIMDAGAHTLPDGRLVEAHSVTSDDTTGRNATDGSWLNSNLEDVSSSIVHSYTNPVVFGQVISHFDSRASVIYVNDCDVRGNHPFQSDMADGICVGNHIGRITGDRNAEDIGYIVAEQGSGTINNVFYELARGADSVAGNNTANTGFSYSLNSDHNIAVLTQAAEDGGDGGWAVLYGSDPLGSNNLQLAVDEEEFEGDSSRNHTTEQVYYWAFTAAEITLVKNVINDDNGTATLAEFPLTATGPSTVTGVSGTPSVTKIEVLPGTYELSEVTVPGYDASAWSCTGATSFAGTTVELGIADQVVCTITNDDEGSGRLTLIKQVSNDAGGAAVAADFEMKFAGPGGSGNGFNGDAAITSVVLTPGVYDLSESALPGYSLQNIQCNGSDTDGSDGVELLDDEDVTCVFLNNDLGVDLSIQKNVNNTTPNIGDTLTFTLDVTNIGPDEATDLQVTDQIPAGFSYVAASMAGGDVRDDSSPTGTGLTWTINSLTSSTTVSLTFQATVLAP